MNAKVKVLVFILFLLILLFSGLLFFTGTYKTLFWKKFQSNRVPLSFSYPPNTPVTQCDDSMTFEHPVIYRELIKLSSECSLNPDKSTITYGYIEVSDNPSNKIETTGMLGNKINYELAQIGKNMGYKLRDNYNKLTQYVISINGIKYTIWLYDIFDKNINGKADVFLKSFRFN